MTTADTKRTSRAAAAGKDPSRRVVTRAALLSAVGGMLFGYDTGVIGGVLKNVSKDFGLHTAVEKQLPVTLLLAGAIAGAFIAGRASDLLGRKRFILITSLTFVVGLVVCISAQDLAWLLAGRFIIGAGVGSASFVVPLYIGELAPPERRGGLVSLNQFFITMGILVSQLVAYFLAGSGDWRISVGLALIPAVILGLGVLPEPESPAWLVRHGDDDAARDVLTRVRRPDYDIQAEIDEIKRTAREESKGSVRDLIDGRVRPALIVGVAVAVIQQLTGINTVIYFAPTLLENAGLGQSAALLAVVIVGATNVVLTIASILLLDRVGRRPLLLGGTFGMIIGLVGLALLFAGGDLSGARATGATIALCVYVGSFAIGLGPVFWLLVSELFPLRVRGSAASVATMANWAANLAIAVSYLSVLSAIGNSATFWVLGGISVVSLLYMIRAVPETKGRSLSEIERDLTGTKKTTATPRARHA
jgi:sugar porter (SP) family MFS transporter